MAKWLDKYAMGGALPGATGMMYARTQDPAPSNGPYAKKTKASAQDGKEMPKAYWASNDDREAYRKNLKAAAEAALNNNASDEDLLISTSYHDMNSGNNCISGVCGLNRKAGLTYNKPTDQDRFLSGEKFAQAVAKGDEDYYQVSGNFQPGDHLQYRNKQGSSSHNKIIYDIQVDDKGEKMYKVIDNAGGKDMRSRDYTEAELKELVEKGGGGYDKVNMYRPGYNLDKPLLDKEREAKTSPEARAALAERKNIQEWDASHNPGFDYSIRPESEYYNNQPKGMKKFIDFANDDAKVTALAKKLNVGKDIIHDQLLNTFGELGQENEWKDPLFGGDLFKGKSPIPLPFESTIEKVLTAVGGGKGWSVGPGQIKYKTLDPELKKQFGINRPKDLHDFDKVIPLMTAINVKNKKWMENQGDNLSTKLIGTPGVSADEIKYGIDRWVPYAYPGLPTDPVAAVRRDAQENANSYRLSTKDREEYINNYIKKNINPDKIKTFDEGSYAGRVYDLIDKNLSRTMPAQNYEQYNELMPVTVKSKKKMQKGGVIKDDRGQWAYPGEVTEIGSNDITMQGVDYPVLGVSDTGDTQMMYPDQDYKFDGEKVTEFPMAQDGGWLDKYQPEPMRQDATRVAPPVLKLTEREKLENAAKYDQGQKKALVNAKEELAERKKNKATKGDLNTPGSWHTEDKARLSNILPASWAPPGGAVDVFDEYINPATYVGVLTDALGESIAARDPKGIATSLGLSAIGGGLGFDPIGGGIKAVKSIGKGIVKPSFNSGKEAYDFINNMVNNGQEEQMLNILTKKTGKTSRQLENEFGRAIGNDGTIRDPEYIIRHANMLSGKNNLPKFPKSLKELDEKAGKLVSPSSSSEFNTTDSKMIARANEILKKGVGIKNKDIPIELRSKHNGELELWVNDNNPKYVTGQSKSGTIDLSPNFRGANKSLTFTDWLKGKKPTTKYDTYDPDAIPGVIKAGDFPYQSRLDLEGTGIGAETAEALKQALNEEGLQLFSSKSHTEAGKLRYLTEFLNNRKQVVDYNDNPDWMNRASTLRDLLGGAPISKKEAKAYISQYPELKPAHVRFQYDNGGWLNKYK